MPIASTGCFVLANHSTKVSKKLFATGELLKVLHLLDLHNVPNIPFKGPILALSAYGDLARREFSDLDIFVRKADMVNVKAILSSCGYTAHISLASSQEARFLESQCELAFSRGNGRVVVDLHWEFAPKWFGVSIDLEGLWQRAKRISIGGQEIRNLSPEDLLLVLSVHGAKHCWDRTKWICDIAELIRAEPTIKWQAVFERAQIAKAERIVLLAVLLAHRLFNASLPEVILRKAQSDTNVRFLGFYVARNLFRQRSGLVGALERTIFQLMLKSTLRERLIYCLRLAATPSWQDWSLVRLPAALSMLYLILRPLP